MSCTLKEIVPEIYYWVTNSPVLSGLHLMVSSAGNFHLHQVGLQKGDFLILYSIPPPLFFSWNSPIIRNSPLSTWALWLP